MTVEPFIITMLKQRLGKGERVFYRDIWGKEKRVTGVSKVSISTMIPQFSGVVDHIDMQDSPGFSVMPEDGDSYTLTKIEGSTPISWMLERPRKRMRESADDIISVWDMIELLMKKGETVWAPGPAGIIQGLEREGAVVHVYYSFVDTTNRTWKGKQTYGVNAKMDLEKRDDDWYLTQGDDSEA